MANADPTGSGQTVALDIPARHVAFLRDTFTVVRDGLLGDLVEQAGRLRDAERSRRKATTLGCLLAALDCRAIVPGPEVIAVLGELAKLIDRDNEYERVIREHEALWGLHRQLVVAAGEGGR